MRLATLLAAALLPTAALAAPGSTIEVVFYNRAMVVLEYTKWYQPEFQSALQTAQNYCTQFGKDAQVASTVPSGKNPYDRVVTSFNCV